MSELVRDFRFALRQMQRRPAFTLVAVLVLAIGAGAASAMFSVVDAVLLKPLPYRDPERLVALYSRFTELGFDKFWISPPEYDDLRRGLSTLEALGAFRAGEVNVSGGSEPIRGEAIYATASLFLVLGAHPLEGRLFSPSEDIAGGPRVAVLGYGLWQRAFGGDSNAIGRTLEIDDTSYQVIGVLPEGFGLGASVYDLWLPLGLGLPVPEQRARHFLNVIGKLKPGIALGALQAELETLLGRWPEEMPDLHVPDLANHPIFALELGEDFLGESRRPLLFLAVTVGLLLVVAGVNLTGLLLVRTQARRREIALRMALGAARGPLFRQLVVEALTLTLLGSAAGLWLAFLLLRVVRRIGPEQIPRLDSAAIDPRVLAFAFFVSVLASLLVSLPLLLTATAVNPQTELKEGGRAGTGSPRRHRLQRAFVITEIALAAALLVTGGLLLRSLRSLEAVDPGVRAAQRLCFRLTPPDSRFDDANQVVSFHERVIERLESIPGVEAAAASSELPPLRPPEAIDLGFESIPYDPQGPALSADFLQLVSKGYFEVMGIPLLEGRSFVPSDNLRSSPVAIVNHTLRKTFWPQGDPLGQRMRRAGGDDVWLSIVGVAGDVKQRGLAQPAGGEYYLLLDQLPATTGYVPTAMYFIVKTALDLPQMQSVLQAELHRFDPTLPIGQIRPLESILGDSLRQPRFLVLLALSFAGAALLLAIAGTYGILSYLVGQSTAEIGIRIALGAQARQVTMKLLGDGLRLVLYGLAIGFVLAIGAGRLMANLLYGVGHSDPWTFLAVAAILLTVAGVACYLPARRAAGLDPLTAIKDG